MKVEPSNPEIKAMPVILTEVSNANEVEESRTASRVSVTPVPASVSAQRSLFSERHLRDSTVDGAIGTSLTSGDEEGAPHAGRLFH